MTDGLSKKRQKKSLSQGRLNLELGRELGYIG